MAETSSYMLSFSTGAPIMVHTDGDLITQWVIFHSTKESSVLLLKDANGEVLGAFAPYHIQSIIKGVPSEGEKNVRK